MPEYYNALRGTYIELSHRPSTLCAPTLRRNLSRLSNELNVAFYTNETTGYCSPQTDTVTITRCTEFDSSAHWFPHTESILMNMSQIVLFRDNVSYADLHGAIELFLDKDALQYAVQVNTITTRVIGARQTRLESVGYELAELEGRIQGLYERQIVLELALSAWGPDELVEQFRSVEAMPDVGGIELSESSKMTVTLAKESVIHVDDYTEVHLGPFNITINFEGMETDNIRFTSEGRYYGDYPHPHISGRTPCWGNLRPQASRFFYRMELVNLIELCVIFLQSYYRADHYCSVYRFFDEAEEYEDQDEDQIALTGEEEGWTHRVTPIHVPT